MMRELRERRRHVVARYIARMLFLRVQHITVTPEGNVVIMWVDARTSVLYVLAIGGELFDLPQRIFRIAVESCLDRVIEEYGFVMTARQLDGREQKCGLN